MAAVALAAATLAAALPARAGLAEGKTPPVQAFSPSPARSPAGIHAPDQPPRLAADRIAVTMADQGTIQVSGRMADETALPISGLAPLQVSGQTSDRIPAQVPRQVPRQVPSQVPSQVPADVSGQVPAPAALHVQTRLRSDLAPPGLPRSASPAPVEVQAQACRQALALGLDVSASVDATEYRLQLDGLAHALLDPGVLSKLLVPGMAPVEIAVFEWSGHRYQAVLVDWIVISDLAAVERLADLLRLTQRRPAPRGTAIGAAMQTGVEMLNRRADCWKRTLDLSGDGQNNVGLHPLRARALAEAAGVTINALVIGTDTARLSDQRQAEISALSSYFRANVITGPDAFVQTALGYQAYAEAMTAKLIRELDSLAVSQADDPAPRRTQPQ